ncbi:MAG TPA: vitamin K epoxide reductase family protein [Actinomycetota bacterium]
MSLTTVPGDGPEASLARVARRLRLPYSRGFVARMVAAHPKAQTLLAVVEVAPSLGLKATPAEVEADALDALDLPLIAHFRGPDGGGFGVLERVGASGYVVWDSVHGRRRLGRDDFLAHWSGIVALVARTGVERASEERHLRNRMAEALFGASDPPAPSGGRGAAFVRILLGALVIGLVAAAIAGTARDDRLAATAVALLSGAGLAVAAIAALATSAHANPVSQRVCARGTLVDCHSVLASRYSRIFGIALTDLGIAFYSGLLLLLATAAAGRATVWSVVVLAFAAAVPVSVALTIVQIAMRRLCTLCLAVHAINVSAAALAWIALRPERWPARLLVAELALLGLLALVVLFVVVPYFRRSHGLEVISAMHRRLSGSPFGSLAALTTEVPTGLRGPDYGIRVGGSAAAHELVVFVHPSCNRCAPVMQEMTALAGSGLVDAYLGLVPKDSDDADRDACAAVLAAALGLGAERIFEAYAAAKRRFGSMRVGDAIEVLAEELHVARDEIDPAWAGARARIDLSERLVDAHADGTPAVFFDGRVYRGPLSHLATLLTEHPDLLAPLASAQRTVGS